MTKYDPTIIQEFADRLYSQAGWITFTYGFWGLLLGAVLGAILDAVIIRFVPSLPQSNMALGLWLICSIVGLLLGVEHGRRKGFELKLRAQTALVQMHTERNLAEILRVLVVKP